MPCRARELVAHRSLPGCVAHRSKSLVVPWSAFPASSSCRFEQPSRQAPLAGALLSSGGLPGKLLLPGPWLKYFVLGWPKKGPWRVLASTWQALPRGATTARAQVRGTKVPLLWYTDRSPQAWAIHGAERCWARPKTVHGHAWPGSRCIFFCIHHALPERHASNTASWGEVCVT